MSSDLEKINLFLQKHHVMSLATISEDGVSVCNLFYAFNMEKLSFVVASSHDTLHIKNITKNKKVAGSVVLETKIVAKIEGLQFLGEFDMLEDDELKMVYFKNFPYALAINPKLWQIKIDYFKLTDNTLGFGKKIIWKKPSA